jgi:DNA repair exonuclease SbcCD ATPase subunit
MIRAFEEKNQEDYEENSILINECIHKIKGDLELKPTLSQLAKLTGMHRNTLSNRVWPKQQLDEIKLEREREKKNDTVEKVSKKDQFRVLEDKLDKAKLELIHWFTKTRDLQDSKTQLEANLQRMTEARDTYRDKLESERKKAKSLESEVERLSDLLNEIN